VISGLCVYARLRQRKCYAIDTRGGSVRLPEILLKQTVPTSLRSQLFYD
jgi:hypothetical protein